MACCGRSEPLARRKPAELPPAELLYTTARTGLTGLDGKTYSLTGALIRNPGKPQGGWKVKIPVKGQHVVVDGPGPVHVFNKVRHLLLQNGMEAKPNDIWLNLNIGWMGRTPAKYHSVPLSDVLKVVTAKNGKEETVDSRKRSYKPQDWGQFAWMWLNLFLARESYSFREFLLQVEYVLDLLSPENNPELGCADCYRKFQPVVAKLRNEPLPTQEGARRWLVDAHNTVNRDLSKKVLSYEEASRKAFWT